MSWQTLPALNTAAGVPAQLVLLVYTRTKTRSLSAEFTTKPISHPMPFKKTHSRLTFTAPRPQKVNLQAIPRQAAALPVRNVLVVVAGAVGVAAHVVAPGGEGAGGHGCGVLGRWGGGREGEGGEDGEDGEGVHGGGWEVWWWGCGCGCGCVEREDADDGGGLLSRCLDGLYTSAS